VEHLFVDVIGLLHRHVLQVTGAVDEDHGGTRSRRVGLVGEEDQRKWLQRKIESAGAALVSVNIADDQLVRGKLFIEKEDEKRMRFLSVQFDGILQVKDPQQFTQTIYTGIGSAKGLGFGLLSLAPVRG
jgi:CRISPR system Cascade subunit CasE